MNGEVKIVVGAIGIVLLVIVALIGVVYVWNGTYLRDYEVTIIVQAVEKSERFGEHTNLLILTYAGEETKTYKFVGHHDFDVGETYRISFINQRGGFLNFGIWGRIEHVEKVR